MSQSVTLAQETITTAMLAAFLATAPQNYALVVTLPITTPAGYGSLAVATFVTAGYLTPHLTAHWLDEDLDAVLNPGQSELGENGV